MVATSRLTKELYLRALQVLSGGNRICILFISDDTSDLSNTMIGDMKKAGVDIYKIMLGDEIEAILTKSI